MNKEKDFLLLTSFVAIGIIVLSLVVTFFSVIVVWPVVIFAIISFLMIIFQVYPKITYISENLENIAFIITLIAIIVSFIYLYKPN
ncbi:hypothetical protein [Methanobrevibacter filiformis]|uniref:Uncharacterized protein n=1 Tax=Methanobrevibacter filiformis TaxID=55758 RepID=A0A166EVR7_9EURY|nr:hypothetical protein [Methanobrevibacter filiformis]KZX17066.1 hypothetical protein MBFIL_03480 [Methanobrevibacter filiformis]